LLSRHANLTNDRISVPTGCAAPTGAGADGVLELPVGAIHASVTQPKDLIFIG